MTFEEEFPGLKGCTARAGRIIDYDAEVCCVEDIQATCLDKQRVRDVITKNVIDTATVYNPESKVYAALAGHIAERMFKELGL